MANYLAQPNALNEPLAKAISGAFDAMASDPRLIHKVLLGLGQEIQNANEEYSAMPARDKGRFIGQVMFYMFNPETDSAAGAAKIEASELEALDLPQVQGSALRTESNEMLAGEATKAGAGGEWSALNERISADVVKQIDKMSCVSACGEMLSEGRFSQAELMSKLGYPAPTEKLADVLGSAWRGTVIIDGLDKSGLIMVRDPDAGMRYEMTRAEFIRVWDYVAVFRR
ncbi:hypothetical protein BH11CYA1_BH11CYA1_06130 [soil metagenome]